MSKNGKVIIDSMDVHIDGLCSTLNFSQSRSNYNTPRVLRCDQSTITDQTICNCSSDTILKLKQKAHRSFMQVIQIQNLYKEQIKDLRNFYEESLKTKDKKYKIKQDILNDRCKQLQAQIERIKDQSKRNKRNESQVPFQLSFDLDINSNHMPDQSNQSINNLGQFIQALNLKDTQRKLYNNLTNQIEQLKKMRQQNSPQYFQNNKNPNQILQAKIIRNIEIESAKMFTFLDKMIQFTLQAHQKHNQLSINLQELENKNSKLYALQEASKKQLKFMTDHIKKISQDKIKLQRKNSQQEKNIKGLEQTIKLLKKISIQNQARPNYQNKKNIECSSLLKVKTQNDQALDVRTLLSSKIIKTKNLFDVRSLQDPKRKKKTYAEQNKANKQPNQQ